MPFGRRLAALLGSGRDGLDARGGGRLFVGFGLLALAVAVVLDAAAPGGRGFLVVTRANPDSVSYFSVARSLLVDHDFDLGDEFARLLTSPELSTYAIENARPVPATGLPGSPYALGTSLVGIPFLAVGIAIDALTGSPADGYGAWAERAFAAANLVWLTLGLYCLWLWLRSLAARWRRAGSAAGTWALVAALALVPATALGYYALTVMSHTASFMAFALFLLLAERHRDSLAVRDWLWTGAAAGLVALCRWPDALLLAVPLVDELMRPGRRERWRRPAWWRSRLAGVAAAALAFAPQIVEWRTLYGRSWLIPQGEDFLAWPPRHVLDVLFSSWNGLFFVTPATLVGALGLLLAARRDTRRVVPLLVAGALLTLAIGAQTRNWTGNAFAQRHLIAALPLVAAGWLWLLLGGRAVRRGTLAAVGLGALFTLGAAIQWRFDLAPRHDRMTFDEAFTDKLRLPSCLRRARALRAALRIEDPAARVAALERVERERGPSRQLLRQLAAAQTLAGDERGAAATSERYTAWLDRRLF